MILVVQSSGVFSILTRIFDAGDDDGYHQDIGTAIVVLILGSLFVMVITVAI